MTNQTLRIDNDKNTTTNKTTLLALRPGWKPMFTAVAVGLMGVESRNQGAEEMLFTGSGGGGVRASISANGTKSAALKV